MSTRVFFKLSRGNWGRIIEGTRHVLDLEERFEVALRGTAKCWKQAVDRRLNRLGVSQSTWMTIAAATQVRSPLSQSELADALAVSRAFMVQTIDRLVKGGLVKRESSTSDRRVKRIMITESGTHLYAVIKDEVAAVRRQLLANIALDELIYLTELLEKLQGEIPPAPGHSLFADMPSDPRSNGDTCRGYPK
jgi:MarR family transcriptional regulator for hemolysin